MHLLSLCSLKIFPSQMTPYANKQKKLAKEISTAYLIPPLLRMFQWAQTQRQCRPHWRKSHLLLVSYPVYNTREVVGSRVFFSLNSRFFNAVPRLKMKNGLFDDLVVAKTHWKHRYSTSSHYLSRLKASAFKFYLYSAHNGSIYDTDGGPFEKFRDYWTKLLVLGLVCLPTGKL